MKFRWYVLIVFLLGMVVFRDLLFKPGTWNRGDTMFPVCAASEGRYAELAKYVWSDKEFLGYDILSQGLLRKSEIWLFRLSCLIMPDYSKAQFLYYLLIFMIAACSMYFLVNTVFRDILAAAAAGIIYGLNPWIIERMAGHLQIFQAYAFIPLAFTFFVMFFKLRKIEFAFLFAMTAFFIIPSTHYTYYFGLILAFFFLFQFFLLEKEWKDRIRITVHAVILCGLTFLVVAFYSIPLLCSFFSSENMIQEVLKRFAGMMPQFFYGKHCIVLNVIRFMGFHDSLYNERINPLVASAGQVFSFVVPALWLISLPKKLQDRFREIVKYFLFMIVCLGIFMSSAVHLVPIKIFQKLLLNLPVLGIGFRLPDPNYNVFFVVFGGSILAGTGFSSLIQKISVSCRKAMVRFVALVVAIAVVLSCYPLLMWQGERFKKIEYPESYKATGEYFDSQSADFRVLLLPPAHYYMHKWSPYLICGLDRYWFLKPTMGPVILEATPTNSMYYLFGVNDYLKSDFGPDLEKILRLANTGYILIYDDMADREFMPTDYYFRSLGGQNNIRLLQRYGDLYIFGLDKNRLLPKIYPSCQPVCVSGGVSNLIRLGRSSLLDGFPALFFLNEENGNMELLGAIEKGKIDRLVLVNRTLEETVLEMNKAELHKIFFGKYQENFRLQRPGRYQIWMRLIDKPVSERREKYSAYILGTEVEVDGKKFSGISDLKKWTRIGGVELKSGDHRIKANVMLPVKYGEYRVWYRIVVIHEDTLAEWQKFLNSKCSICCVSGEGRGERDFREVTPSAVPGKLPEITYTRINPGRYEARVAGAKNPFFLVFCESFNRNWQAFAGEHALDRHFLVNGFANAWLVPAGQGLPENFRVSIEYRGQRIVGVGNIVSVFTAMIMLAYLLLNITRKKSAENIGDVK